MILDCLLANNTQAEEITAATSNLDSRIEPRKILAGVHQDKWAIPARVLSDDAFTDIHDQLLELETVQLVIAEAWPETEEE